MYFYFVLFLHRYISILFILLYLFINLIIHLYIYLFYFIFGGGGVIYYSLFTSRVCDLLHFRLTFFLFLIIFHFFPPIVYHFLSTHQQTAKL